MDFGRLGVNVRSIYDRGYTDPLSKNGIQRLTLDSKIFDFEVISALNLVNT